MEVPDPCSRLLQPLLVAPLFLQWNMISEGMPAGLSFKCAISRIALLPCIVGNIGLGLDPEPKLPVRLELLNFDGDSVVLSALC